MYKFGVLPPDVGTCSDTVEAEVKINTPKETDSPAPFVVETFVLESDFHNQIQGNTLSAAV